jgi:hypothetical protein
VQILETEKQQMEEQYKREIAELKVFGWKNAVVEILPISGEADRTK